MTCFIIPANSPDCDILAFLRGRTFTDNSGYESPPQEVFSINLIPILTPLSVGTVVAQATQSYTNLNACGKTVNPFFTARINNVSLELDPGADLRMVVQRSFDGGATWVNSVYHEENNPTAGVKIQTYFSGANAQFGHFGVADLLPGASITVIVRIIVTALAGTARIGQGGVGMFIHTYPMVVN